MRSRSPLSSAAVVAAMLWFPNALPAEDFNQSLVRAIYGRTSLATRVHTLVTRGRGGPISEPIDFTLLSMESGPVSQIRAQSLGELATPPSGFSLNLVPAQGTVKSPKETARWFAVAASWQTARALPVDFKLTYSDMCKVAPDYERYVTYVRVNLKATLGGKSADYTATYLFPEAGSNTLQFQPLDYFIENAGLVGTILVESIDPDPVLRGYGINMAPNLVQTMFRPPAACVPLMAAKEICCTPDTLACGLTKYSVSEVR